VLGSIFGLRIRDGRDVEGWKDGRMEGGKMEGWKDGEVEMFLEWRQAQRNGAKKRDGDERSGDIPGM
jgi:hypothetical protein